LFAFAYIVITALLTLPIDVYQGYFREKQYGLMNQTLAAWGFDQLKGLALDTLGTGLFVAVIYMAIRRAPKSWWAWGAAISGMFLAVFILIGPVFIEPLFNDYKPMREGELKSQILSMAHSNGVPTQDVLEFDASKQSDRISANVAGLLGTTRIALNDNLLNKTTPQEVRAVMGHEMGHYVLNHATKFLVEFTLMALFAFAFVGWAMPAAIARYGQRWGIGEVSDVAGLPLLFFLLSLLAFIGTPVKNSIIRSAETEADYFGLNLAREPDAFASVALKLSQYRKLSPGEWEEILFYDHPSGKNRILRAMMWKAENMPNAEAPAQSSGQ
jgi:STE24 endopeptidase